MLKIFTTQLLGVFRQIEEKNEELLEDCARLFCQTILSDGKIFIHGAKGMSGITEEATTGKNALPHAQPWSGTANIQSMDAVLYCANGPMPHDAQKDLLEVHQKGGTVILLTTEESVLSNWNVSAMEASQPGPELPQDAPLVLSIGKQRPLVPLENGDKAGYPDALAALYLYHALYLNVLDILEEYR